jgi:hypothetical protein
MYIYCFGLEIHNHFSIMYIRILHSLFGYISNNTIYVEFAPFSKNMIKFVNPDSYNSQMLNTSKKTVMGTFLHNVFLYSSISFSI